MSEALDAPFYLGTQGYGINNMQTFEKYLRSYFMYASTPRLQFSSSNLYAFQCMTKSMRKGWIEQLHGTILAYIASQL